MVERYREIRGAWRPIYQCEHREIETVSGESERRKDGQDHGKDPQGGGAQLLGSQQVLDVDVPIGVRGHFMSPDLELFP